MTAKAEQGSRYQESVLRVQLHVQNNLDDDLSLAAMARLAGMSESHFHRAFKAHLGETPRAYVERLRVETSLYDLYLSDLNVLQISLRYGFKNPETYTRAFKRRFAKAPSEIERRVPPEAESGSSRPPLELGLRKERTSNFTVTRLARLHLAFIRHLGKYEDVPPIASPGETLWRRLEKFVGQKKLASEPYAYLGVAQDNPESTDQDKLRFDVCVLVNGPFRPQGEISHQEIEPGYYGVVRHAGPYSSLGGAYQELFERSSQLAGFKMDPTSHFELLLDTDVKTVDETAWSELYVRLEKQTS